MVQWETVQHQAAIAGRVTDAQRDRPIPGARIEITSAPQAFTDWLALRAKQYGERWETMVERPDRTPAAADGHYHFIDLPDGDYTLTASLLDAGSRYGTAQAQATVSRDAEGDIAMATADIALPPTAFEGQITDQETGDPVTMADVRVQGSGEQAFSDAQGHYLLPGLEAGLRTVLVSAQGYRSASKTALLDAAGTVQTLSFALIPSTLLVGCKLWLQADILAGLSDGDAVGAWPDASDFKFDLAQSEEAWRPAFKSDVVNGLSAVRFDGVDDYLERSLSSEEQWSGDLSLFIVVAALTLRQPKSAAVFSSVKDPGGSERKSTFQIDASGREPGNYRFSTSSSIVIGPVTTGVVLLEVILSGTDLRTYYNGSLSETRTLSGDEGNQFNGFVVGANRDSTQFFNGDVAEIMLYDRALSDIGRQAVEQYLGDRFAIPLA